MKAVAVALFLALCGLAAATTQLRRQNFTVPTACMPNTRAFNTSLANCPVHRGTAPPTPQALCTTECFGAACTYFRNNNLESCRSTLAVLCMTNSQPVPSTCGALALVTFKGVVAAVLLLLTAFLIL